jgi:Pentapeptide repeats (9 copies)
VPAPRRMVAAAVRTVGQLGARPAIALLPIGLALWLPQMPLGPPKAGAAASLECPELSRGRVIPAEAVTACLQRGGRVDLSNKIIRHELDLSPLAAVGTPFACRKCRFEGAIDASEVVFKRTIELTGSTMKRALKMRGTIFEGAALFSGPETPSTFEGRLDFSLVVFNDIASFEEATFKERAAFSSTRFLGDVSFSATTFLAGAAFDGAVFAQDASFPSAATSETAAATTDTAAQGKDVAEGSPLCASIGSAGGQGAFEGPVTFDRATFRGTADFRQRCFGSRGRFAETDFARRVEFVQAEFLRGATFEDARLTGGATFRDAVFDEPAIFKHVTAGGSLDFTVASFLSDADFFGLLSDAALILDDAIFARRIDMGELSAASLVLDVDTVKRAYGDVEKREILRMIESSAKERGDLAVANDASFERRKLLSKEYGPIRRAWDVLVYRGLAGYLVRPKHPLIALAALAFLAALIRWPLVLRAQDSESTNTRRASPSATVATLAWHVRSFLSEYWRTIRRTLRDKQESEPEPQPLFVEVVIYRTLFVVALIGLANSNPTLRQMVDAAL